MRRRNPAPDSSQWTEYVQIHEATKSDLLRGGARKFVWELDWIDAPAPTSDKDRATSYIVYRRWSGIVFNERFLHTHFMIAPAIPVSGNDSWKIEDGVITHNFEDGFWHSNKTDWSANVYVDERDPHLVDDDDKRKIGMNGYFILQKMMARLQEIEASLPKPRKRSRKP